MATLKNTIIGTTNAVELPDQALSDVAGTAKLRFSTTGGLNTLEFYDGTAWRPVTGYSSGIVGTGGQSINYTDHGITHVFTTTGNHTFTPAFTGNVQVMVVGGGGAGGYDWSGAGGAGGVIFNRSFPVSNGTGYSVTVGADGRGGSGGGGSPTIAGQNGGNSVFSTITAQGGGGGGSWRGSSPPQGFDNGHASGRSGGSGGGGSNSDGDGSRRRHLGGRDTDGQGYPGGSGVRFNVDGENAHLGGGGGGAGGGGASAPDGRQNYRGSHRGNQIAGGSGRATDLLGGSLYFAGGGAGGGHLGWNVNGNAGGIGGGGGGSFHHSGPYGGPRKLGQGGGQSLNNGQDGFPTARGGAGGSHTGSGGGGGQHGYPGGNGVVIVRY